MTVIYAFDDGMAEWPDDDSHDPSSEKYYGISFYPDTRINSTSYVAGVDVIVPVAGNGCMYECVSGGNSAATEALFDTIEDEEFIDGDVTWLCKPLTTLLGVGDVITATQWTADAGVTIISGAVVNQITSEIKVTGIPSGITSFILTCEVSITYAGGHQEKRYKSLVIPVLEL